MNKSMKIIKYLVIAGVALLSIAAGAAKVLKAPQEMEFLQGLGLSTSLIILFGLIQIIGGVLLTLAKTRLFGAVIATAGFVVSLVLVFISGNSSFALVSAIPVILGLSILVQASRAKADD